MFHNKSLNLRDCLGLDKVDRSYYINKYKRAGSGNWSADASWSTTSGGAADTTVPTAADDVFLDASSGDLTIDAESVCRSINATGFTGTLTQNTNITIGDATAGASNIAVKYVAGMTFTRNAGNYTFASTSAIVQTIDFGGKAIGNAIFNGAGGSWQLTSALNNGATHTVWLDRGTLDTNGQTCSWGAFNSSNSNTRVLKMGASSITITGTGTPWNTSSSSFTISANTATVTLSGSSATFSGGSLNYNGLSVVMSGAGTQVVQGVNTVANLTRTGPAAKTGGWSFGASQTITGTLTINSNSNNDRLLVFSIITGSAITLTAAAVVITNTVDFQDIVGAGAATWTVAGTGATYLGDCGGNSGITFTPAETQTVTMSTNKNASDVTIYTSRVPLPQDNVSMAGVTGGTLTADMPRMGKSIDWTGATGSPTWSFASTANTTYGSVTLISGMTISGTQALTFAGRGSYTITSAGKSWTNQGNFSISAPGGTYSLSDALSLAASSTLFLNAGTFTTNNYTLSLWAVNSSAATTKVFNPGSSTINIALTTTSFFWQLNSGSTYNGGSETIVLTATSANTRTFGGGGGGTYGTLTYTVAGSTGKLTLASSTSFAAINFSDANNARTLEFTQSTTTTIRNTNGFNVNGTSGKLMTVQSSTATAASLVLSAIQSRDYLVVTNINAGGGSTLYAGHNSTDGTGNTNVIFADYFTQECADSLTLDDVITKTTSKVLADDFSLADVLNRSNSKLLTESLTLDDVIVRSTTKELTESIALVDRLINSIKWYRKLTAGWYNKHDVT